MHGTSDYFLRDTQEVADDLYHTQFHSVVVEKTIFEIPKWILQAFRKFTIVVQSIYFPAFWLEK